jgi:hypothetical protein
VKAKEYAQRIIEAPTNEDADKAVIETMKGVFGEFVAMVKARNAQFVPAIAAIIGDFDRKWRNIYDMVNNANPSHTIRPKAAGFITVVGDYFKKIDAREWQLIESELKTRSL